MTHADRSGNQDCQATLQQTGQADPQPDTRSGRLYLQCSPAGTKSWLRRFKRRGETYCREIGLGPYPAVSLSDARKKNREITHKLDNGIDPLREKASAQSAPNVRDRQFRTVALVYIAAHEAEWANSKHRQQWRNTLETYAYPVIGEMDVQDIMLADVLRVLQPIWHSKTETASRLRGRIECIFDAAIAKGMRSHANPATWGLLQHCLADPAKIIEREHYNAMPYKDVRAFLARLRQQDGMSAIALEFAIFTCCRTKEVIGAMWDEINLDKALWIIPKRRMGKGKMEHRVPLSPPAVAILRKLRPMECDSNAYVFPGRKRGRPLSNMAMIEVLRGFGLDYDPHGFGSSFRDWAAECTQIPREIAEMCLAHRVKGKTEEAYWRSDVLAERRKLMERSAKYCSA